MNERAQQEDISDFYDRAVAQAGMRSASISLIAAVREDPDYTHQLISSANYAGFQLRWLHGEVPTKFVFGINREKRVEELQALENVLKTIARRVSNNEMREYPLHIATEFCHDKSRPLLPTIYELVANRGKERKAFDNTVTAKRDFPLRKRMNDDAYHAFHQREEDLVRALRRESGIYVVDNVLASSPFVHEELVDDRVDYMVFAR
jgi:hypothetical protein